MKKIFVSVLVLLVLIYSGVSFNAYAASELPYDGSFYFDGFPVDGKVISSSSASVYDSSSFEDPIDTLGPDTELTLLCIFVTAAGEQFYKTEYIKEGATCTGYVSFNLVEPIDAEITPAPVIDFEYTEPNLSGFFKTIKEFIYTVIDFFAQLHSCIFILFPFLTDSQVNFLITFLSIFMAIGVYLLFRKVTI